MRILVRDEYLSCEGEGGMLTPHDFLFDLSQSVIEAEMTSLLLEEALEHGPCHVRTHAIVWHGDGGQSIPVLINTDN